jgi:16S rRNA (cytosine1402-N4)-methyltransferase
MAAVSLGLLGGRWLGSASPYSGRRLSYLDMPQHDPVMLREIIDTLPLRPGGIVVDGTLGLGGHSIEMMKRISPGGTIVGFDWDESMLRFAHERLASRASNLMVTANFIHDDFRNVASHLNRKVDGILLDLGLNSAQVEDPERGISFRDEGPLDMRMDRSRGEPASALLNRWSMQEIEQALWDYGDERWARNIARKIVERRKAKPLRTTSDLVECVMAAIPAGARDKRIHPATRSFQAIRIVVNGELEELGEALESSASCLAEGGVLAVLSYHSGEDRIVKNTFRELARGDDFEDLMKKPMTPTQEEVARNPRSRSAKLRAIRRKS